MAFFLGHKSYVSLTFKGQDYIFLYLFFQEDQNRGKPNWEHLNDELHVLITVEDSENRAQMKLQRAVEEVKKLLTVVSTFFLTLTGVNILPKEYVFCEGIVF